MVRADSRRWSRTSILKRIAAATLSAVVVTALLGLDAHTRHVPADRPTRGLLTELLPSAQHVGRVSPARGAARPGVLGVGASAERDWPKGLRWQATFQKGQALPSKAHPQLAMVLVPRRGAATTRATPAPGQSRALGVPVRQALPPAKGDNQAAAFNTTDDSATYDVAFALVWATGDEVLNVNEAHAYASCSNCVTVAVAFQVVLIMDDARVVVPQNLSVAANYQCYRCITAAIASQLVLSVEETPGETSCSRSATSGAG